MFRGQECNYRRGCLTDAFEGLDIVLGAAENDIAERFAPRSSRRARCSSTIRARSARPQRPPLSSPRSTRGRAGYKGNGLEPQLYHHRDPRGPLTPSPRRAPSRRSPLPNKAVSGAARHRRINTRSRPFSEGKHLEPKVFQYQIAYNIIPRSAASTEVAPARDEDAERGPQDPPPARDGGQLHCARARHPQPQRVSVVLRTKEKISVERAKELIANAPGCKSPTTSRTRSTRCCSISSDQDTVLCRPHS